MRYVEKLVIDKNLSFTPFYVDKSERVIHSDHFACLLSFENIPLKVNSNKVIPPKEIKWNTNRKNGWEKYAKLTTNNRKLDRMVKDSNFETPDEIDKCINKELKKVEFEAFGKVGVKEKMRASPE